MSIYIRHDEVPVLATRQATVEAVYFNRVCVALRRRAAPPRVAIPGLKTLDLLLLDDAWVVVDRAFNDIPVLAWSDFEADCRDNLHEPIGCRVRFYHAHAGMIMNKVLKCLDELLGERLEELEPKAGEEVLTFTRGE